MSPSVRTAGFSLVEVLVVAALLVPLLLVVGTASQGVVGAIGANQRAADSSAVAVVALGEIERVLRFGRLGTLRVQATRDDVRAGRAAAVGDWFEMPAHEPRPGVDLLVTTGERDLALQIPTQECRLEFVRDARELANGADDDGDGMVDEGELRSTLGDRPRKVLGNLELCTFELDGHAIHVTLRYVGHGHGQSLHRTTLHHTVYLLNE